MAVSSKICGGRQAKPSAVAGRAVLCPASRRRGEDSPGRDHPHHHSPSAPASPGCVPTKIRAAVYPLLSADRYAAKALRNGQPSWDADCLDQLPLGYCTEGDERKGDNDDSR